VPKNVKVTGVQRADEAIDTEMIAVALWIQAKRQLREKRARAAKERAKRQEREHE
jgi:hypothetical protein